MNTSEVEAAGGITGLDIMLLPVFVLCFQYILRFDLSEMSDGPNCCSEAVSFHYVSSRMWNISTMFQ